MSDKFEDILITLYKRNEEYHDVKERVVWLAGVIYLTFSVVTVGWYLQNRETRCVWHHLAPKAKCYVTIFLIGVFLLTTAFISIQTWHKVRSAVMTKQFDDLINNFDYPRGYNRTYKALMKANKYDPNFLGKLCNFIWMGWSGHIIFGVTYSFFLAQMVALHGFAFFLVSRAQLLLFLLPYVVPIWSVLLQPFRMNEK